MNTCVYQPIYLSMLAQRTDPFLESSQLSQPIYSSSVVDPDPHGSGTFVWIRIRN